MFFISAGCSYSQVPNTDVTWPAHLQKQLDLTDEQVIHAGVGAIGNSMISRRTIYHVTQALKTHKPEDLLVGILWSGCDRHNFILRETENIYNKSTKLSFLIHMKNLK
jgi:antitoxin component of MazEF toxin-antitoxin module